MVILAFLLFPYSPYGVIRESRGGLESPARISSSCDKLGEKKTIFSPSGRKENYCIINQLTSIGAENDTGSITQ